MVSQVVETCRKYSMDPSMFHRWKESYEAFEIEGLKSRSGRIEPEIMKLRKENERLKLIIAEKKMEVAMLRDAFKQQ